MENKVKESTEAEVRAAVTKAKAAQEKWRSIGLEERIKVLRKLHAELSKRREELALLETKEMGKPIKESLSLDIDSGLDYFKWYLDNAQKYISPEVTFEDDKSKHTVYYEPTGTTAVISPWNFPFSNFVWGVAANLVVGNTVVYKHSEECILFGKRIEEIVNKVLPKGVFYVVHGGPKVGKLLINQDVDLICFTGSAEVGQQIYQTAAKKFIKVVLELGGSAPGLVFEDADLDSVMESIYFNRFFNCGQVCDGLKRLLVHKSIFDRVVEGLKQTIRSKKVGNPEDKDTDIGPLVSEKQLKTLEAQVKDAVDKGAKVVIGGKHVENLAGPYYEPTLLTNVKPDMKVWREEVFGPVLPIVPFSSEDEAIRLANDTSYGLGAYIFTRDKEKALRVAGKLQTGMVAVNNTTYVMPCNPFGGYKKSGIGREHGKYGLRELCQVKVISIDK
ncbi:aldehyde dehydrogenase family protein [Candidatus Micrarchaeota archaeon]|nr:aldehyde dehydrogenase family protein [Candidatus Micrarchaeota archaeon]